MIVTSSPTAKGAVAFALGDVAELGVVTLVLPLSCEAPVDPPVELDPDGALPPDWLLPVDPVAASSFTRERSLRVDRVGAWPAELPTAPAESPPVSGSVGSANATGARVAAAATANAAVVH
jgi:hypothetical protein